MADLEVVAVPTTPEGVLCRAAEVMEEVGWGQHDYLADDGRVCVLGACMVAAGGDPARCYRGNGALFDVAVERLADHLHASAAFFSVATWNDKHCKSQEQAVSALRVAAGGCKEAGGG
jgi:hypothetical protein